MSTQSPGAASKAGASTLPTTSSSPARQTRKRFIRLPTLLLISSPTLADWSAWRKHLDGATTKRASPSGNRPPEDLRGIRRSANGARTASRDPSTAPTSLLPSHSQSATPRRTSSERSARRTPCARTQSCPPSCLLLAPHDHALPSSRWTSLASRAHGCSHVYRGNAPMPTEPCISYETGASPQNVDILCPEEMRRSRTRPRSQRYRHEGGATGQKALDPRCSSSPVPG